MNKKMQSRKPYMWKVGPGNYVIFLWDENVQAFRSGPSRSFFEARAALKEVKNHIRTMMEVKP